MKARTNKKSIFTKIKEFYNETKKIGFQYMIDKSNKKKDKNL